MALHHRGFPIRKSAGQRLFPPNRGLSQVITSFIGSQCQGIHLMLFFAWTVILLYSLGIKTSLAWASQIIVLGCKLKDLLVLIHCCLSPSDFSEFDEIVFYPYLYGKTFWLVSFFFTILITSFSQYTTICFVSFLIRFSMSIFASYIS